MLSRGNPTPTSFPPGPVVERGPAKVREGGRRGGGGGPDAAGAYPEGVDAPEHRLIMESYGLQPMMISPPFTTLTAYDLNAGTLDWQIGLGDDPRLLAQGIKGTGSPQFLKGSVIPTANGLLFVNAADRKVHVYDSQTGQQIHELQLGATTNGSPSMYEWNGRQYLLVSASDAGGGYADQSIPVAPGPTGLIAYALPR
jgi:quinoprotein glucose dehydrogenase